MADNCVCCGKKLGLFSGCSELGERTFVYVCNDCYALFSDYIETMTYTGDVDELEKAYNDAHEIISKSNFIESGKTATINYFQKLRKKRKVILTGVDEEKEQAEKEKQIEIQKQREINENYFKLKREFMMTTGYNFEGYEIVQYCGVVSGEVVLGTGLFSEFAAGLSDFLGDESNAFAKKMRLAKDAAKNQLMNQALLQGGNAVIGVDFDYLTFSNNMIGVSANGTAVIIEKKV